MRVRSTTSSLTPKGETMEKFAKYIGVPGLLALIITLAMVAWVSVRITVPPEVYALMGAAWGYYFATNGKVIVTEQKGRASDVTKSDPPVK